MEKMPNLDKLLQGVVTFSLFLYNIPQLPKSSVQDIIWNIKRFFIDLYIPLLLNEIEKNVKEHENEISYQKIIGILKSHKDSFNLVDSEKKRFSIYKKDYGYTEPISYLIGKTTLFEENDKGHVKAVKYESYGISTSLKHSLRLI